MKSSFKDRLTIISLIVIFVAIIATMGYVGLSKHKPTAMLTNEIIVVDRGNSAKIEQLRNRPQDYAFIVQDNENLYLNAFRYSSTQNSFLESKFIIPSEQLNELSVDKSYWFNVKLSDSDDSENGTISKIYTSNPAAK